MLPAMPSCKRCVVSGKVQGVWFRASAKREADRLGVTGHARNLADGSVEVLACGADDSVAALIEWLHAGPPQARVAKVVVEDFAAAAPAAFETK
jgi:acylphosphatase